MAKTYYINPEKFSIVKKTDTIRIGFFSIYRKRQMFQLMYMYIAEIIQSSDLPFCINSEFYAKQVLDKQLETNTLSETPFDGLQISIIDKEYKSIFINGYEIRFNIMISGGEPEYYLYKDSEKIETSLSLYNLVEKAKNG